jgi:hypothetical protein
VNTLTRDRVFGRMRDLVVFGGRILARIRTSRGASAGRKRLPGC